MTIKTVMIRGMEHSFWMRAKIAALRKRQTMAEWMTEAIRAKLRKEEVK
uniref:Uncharacterized protein n=1 Tax=viral metagenome TaxID=1070528 RepID=A0A6M3LWK5_9ZZZZ